MGHFHAKSGEGYSFIGDCIIELDALNPQVAARLAGDRLTLQLLLPFLYYISNICYSILVFDNHILNNVYYSQYLSFIIQYSINILYLINIYCFINIGFKGSLIGRISRKLSEE